MSDDIIKRLRGAIAAGPTPGYWDADFASAMRNGSPAVVEYFVRRDGDDISIAADIVDPSSGLPSAVNANYIAAASPDNIAALLDRLDAAEREVERMRAVVSALAFQASRDPFVSVGHWCEHGPCAAIIRDISNPNADHHGPDWTERDSEYLK